MFESLTSWVLAANAGYPKAAHSDVMEVSIPLWTAIVVCNDPESG
jgi:hypothetical protein